MLNKLPLILALATSVFLTSVTSTAQLKPVEALPENVPDLLVKINEAFVAKNYPLFRDALIQLHKHRPDNSDYMYQLVIAHALLDEKQQAYDMMVRMQQQGLAYDFTKTDQTANIRGTEVFDYVNDLMVMAQDPVGEAEVILTLPQDVAFPEALSWDETRQKFLVGTMADGSILTVDKEGEATELLKADEENGMWGVIDILVDLQRNRLWVSSAATPGFSRFDVIDQGRSALFEFNLETLEFIRRYPVSVDGQPHALGNMVLTSNGDIYVADRVFPIVYRKLANEQKLEALMVAQDMVSMRGVAMQPDGRILYIADREMGILVLDLEARRSGKLLVPETLNLGGLDGLYLWDNHLVVIQNGIKPQRVMRLELDATGTKVEAIRPLAVAQPNFDFPSFGVLRGKNLYYFGNSQWLGSGNNVKPITVLRTSVDASEDLVGPDMRKYLEERGKKLEARSKKLQEQASKSEEKQQ